MSTTTPSHHQRPRSKSPRRSRPTTPLRPSSRASLRDSSAQRLRGPYAASTTTPLELLQDDFAELSDAMADLEANFMQLHVMHESLARFGESFAAFLYGLNMNAFCVDFPEAPIPESFTRPQNNPHLGPATSSTSQPHPHPPSKNQDPNVPDVEATFLTTDTSFVENPPSSRATSKFSHQQSQTPQTPAPASKVARGRGGGIPRAGGRAGGIPTRGGVPRGASRGSGIARGTGRGRGRGS
ncbi:uncharacterized protein EI97DRAFT_470393 [Westerdykella ornata]|uniref:DASH complex subunit DAM1 n=1 Tax=Westerdykella ornata TaxID=318751 RepID=A0A6A6J860_WESOR|nr:uncharacterized protein EI97DRAFT_470393 [Westerdykella ornata]KAF2272427.1 hypothetical protein EI97DRAFT_470393 [Westerdykella ornata]